MNILQKIFYANFKPLVGGGWIATNRVFQIILIFISMYGFLFLSPLGVICACVIFYMEDMFKGVESVIKAIRYKL